MGSLVTEDIPDEFAAVSIKRNHARTGAAPIMDCRQATHLPKCVGQDELFASFQYQRPVGSSLSYVMGTRSVCRLALEHFRAITHDVELALLFGTRICNEQIESLRH